MAIESIDFPADDMSAKDKLDAKKFGTPIAKAIWNKNLTRGNSLFFNSRRKYYEIDQWLFGKNLESYFDPFLGIKPNDNDKTWYKAIDRQIKNYLTKRVNIALGKVLNRKYDVTIDNIDPIAIDAKEDVSARLQLLIDYKPWFDKMSKQAQIDQRPEGVDPGASLPINRNELDLFMDLDYKTVEEIGMELGAKHHLRRNKWAEIRAQQAYFGFARGVKSVYVGMDENNLPIIESWDPADLILPFSQTPSFSEVPYIAGFKNLTIPEFRKMAASEWDEGKIKRAIELYAKKPDTNNNSNDHQNKAIYDEVDKIPMLLYNYRSTDVVVASEHQDKFGNKKLHYKSRQYYSGEGDEEKFKQKYGNSRKLHRKSYNTVYEGWWIVNCTDEFPPLRHGPRATSLRKRGNLSEDLMGFKVFAPNAWNGNIVSTGEQMIPMAKELQRYYLKIQQLVSKMIPAVIGIDLYALQKASLKWDGRDLSDQDKIEMYMRQHIFIYNSKDRYAPGSNYKPFHVEKQGTGDEIDKLLKLIQQSLYDLDEVIGFTRVTAASTLPADSGKATTEIQVEATDIALGYLYDADFNMFEEVVQTMGCLHVPSVKANPDYYNRIFGRLKTGVTYSSVPFGKYDYGFHVKVQPSTKEWDRLYMQAEKAYDKGVIKFSDILMLQELESIKQARKYLIMRERQFDEMQMKNSQTLQQQNQQTQSVSIKEKAESDAALLDKEHGYNLQLEQEKRNTLAVAHDYKLEENARQTLNQGVVEKQNIQEQGTEQRMTEQVKGIIQKEIAKISASKSSTKK
jgi:hypothetical protein